MSVGNKNRKTLLILFVVLTFLIGFLPIGAKNIYAEGVSEEEQSIEQIELQAEVIWNNLPEAVSIPETHLNLVSGDQIIESVKIDIGDEIVKFAPVDKVDGEGALISYEIEQEPLENFETTIKDFKVENSFIGAEEIIPEDPPVEEKEPVEEAPPVEEKEPIEEAPPVEEKEPIEEAPPVEEKEPIEEAPPVEEKEPIEEPVKPEKKPEKNTIAEYAPPVGEQPKITLPKSSYRGFDVKTSSLTDTIAVYKTAVRSPGCRTFEVTLDITGTPQKAPVDVVLVIDRSGSMNEKIGNYWSNTRLYYAKQAAVNFASRVLGPNGIPGSRVSVVSFSGPTYTTGDGDQNQASTDLNLSTSLTTVTNTINGISAVGGTNTEAGFIQGQTVIQGATSNQNPNSNKVVIMLTDGLPTASNGNQYAETTDINHVHIQSAINAGKNIYQNNIADVFTIGLTTGMNATEKALANNILTQAQNKGYYPAPSATDLDAIFDAISQSLGYAATNATVVDKIGDKFDLVLSSLPAGATYNSATREITWNPGTIVDSAQLKYVVQAKASFPGGLADTNESATLTYKDIFGTAGKTKTFPKPKVNVPTLIEISLTDANIVLGESISLGEGTDPDGENYMSPVTGGDNDGTTFTYKWRVVGDSTVISTDKNPSVSPSVPTDYEVTVTDSNGCIAKATMTVTPAKSVTATKEWDDGPDNHPTVWFKLYRKIAGGSVEEVPGAVIEELTNGDTTANWTGLPTVDSNGKVYTYSVKEGQLVGTTFTEGAPPNYQVSYSPDGLTVTNTYQIPMTGEVEAVKAWVNGPAEHPTVWFKLYRKIASGTLEAVPGAVIKELVSGNTTANWTGLATTDVNGNPYTFSVKEGQYDGTTFTEGAPENYQVSYSPDGLTVTNTYQIPTTGKVQAKKVWTDGPATHPTVWFKLYRKIAGGTAVEVPGAPLEELESGDLTANWSGLETTDINGKPYIFSVKEGQYDGTTFTEGPPTNYQVSYSSDGLTVTNTYQIPMTGEVEAVKVWINGPTAHPTVWFKLYRVIAGGTPEAVPGAVIKELVSGNTTANWTGLATTDLNGNPYTFSVVEGQLVGSVFTEGAPPNYQVSYSPNGLTVTNTYQIPMTGEVEAVKAWVNGPTVHPTVWFKLYRKISGGNLEEVPGAPLEKLENGDTTANWTGLATTDLNGNPYTFSVKEGQVVGGVFTEGPPQYYTVTYSGDGLTVTNTYALTTVNVSKIVKGNLGDRSKEFSFTAKLSNGAEFPYFEGNYVINPSNPSEATFTLKDGESVSMIVPIGASLSIVESDNAGYAVTVKQDGSPVPYPDLTVTVPSEKTTIEFTNTKDETIDTGIAMDSVPYMLILALLGAGGVGGLIWKRKKTEFD